MLFGFTICSSFRPATPHGQWWRWCCCLTHAITLSPHSSQLITVCDAILIAHQPLIPCAHNNCLIQQLDRFPKLLSPIHFWRFFCPTSAIYSFNHSVLLSHPKMLSQLHRVVKCNLSNQWHPYRSISNIVFHFLLSTLSFPYLPLLLFYLLFYSPNQLSPINPLTQFGC